MSEHQSGRGGARPGAGRKPRSVRFERPIAKAEKRIADRLPELIDTQFALALGGTQRIEERWEPAGMVLIDDHVFDDNGRANKIKKLAFPDEDPDRLVLVERKVLTLAPDRAANEYLIDRILGKPTASVELSGPDGGDICISGKPDLSRLPAEDLEALERLLLKATPDVQEGRLTDDGSPDTGGGAGGA